MKQLKLAVNTKPCSRCQEPCLKVYKIKWPTTGGYSHEYLCNDCHYSLHDLNIEHEVSEETE